VKLALHGVEHRFVAFAELTVELVFAGGEGGTPTHVLRIVFIDLDIDLRRIVCFLLRSLFALSELLQLRGGNQICQSPPCLP